MLILLPPSEGKAAPRRGRSLDLPSLGSPCLTPAREQLLDALVSLAGRDDAAAVLGLGATQADLVELDARVRTSPTARADTIYTGVLYDALDLPGLSPAARRRTATRVAVVSSLFGLVRPADRIPSYRLSGDTSLPGIGPVAGIWRQHLGPAVTEALGSGLLVDLRSTTYAAFWRAPADLARRVATVRVLHDDGATRKVVSHFNKATKGRLVRALLEDGANPRTPLALAADLARLGWTVEPAAPTSAGTRLDVVVSSV